MTVNGVETFEYVGKELELFELAHNWKRYCASRIRPYLTGDVLEVGAGFGANIGYLYDDAITRWVSLEPDARLCTDYRRRQSQGCIPAHCELVEATQDALPSAETFDTVIYIDVLEHIRDDQAEFDRCFKRLRPGGKLMILCPAHNFLFSPFDTAIGHFRRYNKAMYREMSGRVPLVIEYLDSVGMVASFANKLLLRQSYPNEKQVKLWDRLFVRMSRLVDPLTCRMLGKSILGVWQK